MNEPLCFALIERDCKRIARLKLEPYAAWILRFCNERKIPWREEYAVPVDETPAKGKRA